MAKIAVILSGCGFLDGSEIHESVLTLLALAQAGHSYQCFAPNSEQYKVVNHLTGEESSDEARNILVESARIARGKIKPLEELDPDAFDSILLPGGFGAALNLCSFALEQENCTVNEKLKVILQKFHASKKPIAATCIAPVILAKTFQGRAKMTMTVGSDSGSLEKLSQMGMNPESARVTDCVVDEENKVFTTPCYMEPDDLAGMFAGIQKLVAHLE